MCDCANVEMGSYDNQVTVDIPTHMSGYKERRMLVGLSGMICIDRCILPEINYLWAQGITTYGSCCGHNKIEGMVNTHEDNYSQMIRLGYAAIDNRRDAFTLKTQ